MVQYKDFLYFMGSTMAGKMDDLTSGSGQVAQGASDLATGAGTLKKGASDLATGATKLRRVPETLQQEQEP